MEVLILMKLNKQKLRFLGFFMLILSLVVVSSGCGGGAKQDAGKQAPANQAADKKEDKSKPEPKGSKVESIAIGTASAGSSSNAQGVAFAKIITDDLGIPAKATSVGGSDAVMKNISEGRLQAGIGVSGAVIKGYQNNNKIRTLLVAQRAEPRQLIVRADSGIKTPKDLEGKKLAGKRPALKDLEDFTNAIIEVYKLDKSKIQIVETTETNEATRLLKQGTVDAAVLPGDLRSAPLTELAENTAVKFISIPDEQLQQIMKKMNQGLAKAVIPKGTYKGNDEDVFTIGFQQTLSATSDLPDDVAYNIVKAVLGNKDRLFKLVLAGKDWLPQGKLIPVEGVPLHPGAEKYYKEQGWIK